MDIYAGNIPSWLSDDDIKKLDFNTRKGIINSAVNEGDKGFSGRKSLTIFNDFLNKHYSKDEFVTMEIVEKFFLSKDEYIKKLPEGFLKSIVDSYDYNLMQEIKEAIYYYNETQIERDIKNYLFSINFDTGTTVKSDYTGDIIDIDEDYFKNFEAIFLGTTSTIKERQSFRQDVLQNILQQLLLKKFKFKNLIYLKQHYSKNFFINTQKTLKKMH